MFKRKKVSDEERSLAAEAAKCLLMVNPFFSMSKHIACYVAKGNEFDTAPIILAIWNAHKNCYLPVLGDREKKLEFASYAKQDTLRLNRYAILEPDHKNHCSLETLDLILVPLLGFDLKGNRLGMGGGYYDRTFQFLDKKSKKPYLLGVGYEWQCLNSIEPDVWDVPLNGVLTEKKIYSFD